MSFYFKLAQGQGFTEEQAQNNWCNFMSENYKEGDESNPIEIEKNLLKIKNKNKSSTTDNNTKNGLNIKKREFKFNSEPPKSLIGGLKPEIYLTPPEKYNPEWVFYIPRCDFSPDKYKQLLPIIEDSYLPNSYGKLLPESYYFGILKKNKGKYYIDIDDAKITNELEERVANIYNVSSAIENKYYPSTYDLKKYKFCVEIIKTNPDSDWSSLVPLEYQFIYGGIEGFHKLLTKK